jgi:hypothetical protein
MAESDFSTPRGVQPTPRASAAPTPQRRIDICKFDIITARHTQALAVLSAITADLTSGESVLSSEVIAGSLWAVEALIEQAQAAAIST